MTASQRQALITRESADRLPGVGKAAGALASYAFIGSWIYSGFSADFDEILVDFPEELTALMGGSLVGATGGYIASVMLNLLAPLVFVGLAVSWGAGVVAREEAAQTARLLFAQPVSRREVLVDRAVVLAVGITVGVGVFIAVLGVAIAIFDENTATVLELAGTGLHLVSFAIAMGMIGLAAGSATGLKAAGVAAGAGVTLVSYLIDSFAPLTSAAGLERFTPWHLYNGNDPIDNGADLAKVAILIGISLCFLAVGYVTVTRRDLETGQGGLQRFASVGPAARQRVSSVFARTLSVRSASAIGIGVGLAVLAVGMALLFDSVGAALADVDVPEALDSAFGGSAIASPVGWMNAELMSIIAPAGLLALTVSMGLDAIAGERESRTMALVLSVAPSRTRFLVEKVAAMTAVVVLIVSLVALGLFIGSGLGGLELSAEGIIGASIHLGALGLFFGAVATAAGARLARRTAFSATVGLAGLSFLSQTVLRAVDGPGWLVKLSPWDYYIGSNPLENGLAVLDIGVLFGLSALVVGAGLALFRKADLA